MGTRSHEVGEGHVSQPPAEASPFPWERGSGYGLDVARDEADAFRILTSSTHNEERLAPHQAADEIITIFCRLHGGLEEAMPIIRTQFRRAEVDFSSPTKAGLLAVVERLVDVSAFLKGKKLAALQKKRYVYIVNRIR